MGYSGGPDSKVLLYSLLECGVIPHIAHVDHGWRESSREEAHALKEEALTLGCPFFSTRIDVEKTEDAAREARLSYFASFKDQYEAVILAHTRNDLAETVLKRILEGAHLANLGGMQPVSKHGSMNIWRPLLPLSRSEILAYLSSRSLTAFEDPSNKDQTYLRARMRKEIFPLLNHWFGKETSKNLALLSERSYELKQYLDRKTKSVPKQKGPWGTIFDLSNLEPLEIRHQLQKIARSESLVFSRSVLDTLANWVLEFKKSKHLQVKQKKIFVDNQRVWVFFEGPTSLKSEH